MSKSLKRSKISETKDVVTSEETTEHKNNEPYYNWKELCDNIKKNGTINSILTAISPTITTSQIIKNEDEMSELN